MAARKSTAPNASANVSTVAERLVARRATGVFTTSTKDYAGTATIGRAKLTAAATKAITFVRNPH